MSTYIIDSETETTTAADADEMLIFDASASRTRKLGLDNLRQYVGSGVIELTASDAITPAEHANRAITLNALAGLTATLPAATGTGNTYTFAVSVTVTSNDYIIQVANATDEFLGTLLQTDVDTSDTLASYPALDADGFDTITLNGSTSGGILGDRIVLTDMATGKWLISGHINSTGIVVTPFSAAV